jgi:hypothetical protein
MRGRDIKVMVDKAQAGDNEAILKIIEIFEPLIKAKSNGDEDCKQYIMEQIIRAIKRFTE